MRKYLTGLGRLTVAVAVAAVVLVQGYPTLVQAAKRDYPRCIQACNDVRKACSDQCTVTCTNLYPTNTSARDACIAACKGGCAAESEDCKLNCNTTPPPPTEEEP